MIVDVHVHLTYGTDWPICRMRTYLKFVRSLGLSEKHLERILWRNADDFYKLGLAESRGTAAPAEFKATTA